MAELKGYWFANLVYGTMRSLEALIMPQRSRVEGEQYEFNNETQNEL